MKIHLINSPQKSGQDTSGFEFLYPPLGPLYLASYARKKLGGGMEFKFTDGLLLGMRRTLDEVKSFKPDILGVSFTTSACEGAFDFINEVKRLYPDMLAVAGGPHPSVLPEEVLARSTADICVIGEGEETFAEILSGRKVQDIHGIVYRDGDSVIKNPSRKLIQDLDTIPFPARDLIEDWSIYKGYYLAKRRPDMVVLSSRGCPYQCIFCSNPVWKTSKPYFRKRSPENIVEELSELKGRYGTREVFDETDDFNLSKENALKVSRAIAEARLGLTFKFQVRANTMDAELARSIREMGAWLVFIGAESGNQRTLDGVKKKIKTEDIERCARLLSEQKIKVYGLFMGFNVWEEDGRLCYEGVEESRNTIRFAKGLINKGYMHFMGFSLTTPFPGSELYAIARRHKLITEAGGWSRWNDLWRLNLKLPGMGEGEWRMVKSEAGRVQALCALRSGDLNLKTIYPLVRRGLKLVKYSIKKTLAPHSESGALSRMP
jgi:anaerobic magnesium-protoporphyrin IX monomethyl ester cyclase